MSFEGVWTAEMFGPHGWDGHGVLLLQDGRLAGGDNQQCTSGTYVVHGEGIEAELMVDHYDQPRTIFGDNARKYTTRLSGRLKGSVISGIVVRPDRPEFELQIRLTRRMDLPAHDRALSGRPVSTAREIDPDDNQALPVLQ
ncbi:MAG: hypothetical protein AAF299_18025 [Pseudomonadota bacterium]